ncbi:MAG: hypothetical protein Q8Q96_00185 [bacterium]|nr:hypothetical protein [bacterium]
MQSFIISSKNQSIREEYAKKICGDHHVDRFDIYNVGQEKGTIGIEEVRNLQKKLFLKPLKSPVKAVVIKNAENLTLEAQNALLKSLEEPPDNTIIILTASNKDLLLPTILSRCKIVELKKEEAQLSKNEISQYLDIFISLRSCGVGERLKLAQEVGKTKEEALVWLEAMIFVIRKELIVQVETENYHELSASQHLNLLTSLQQAYTTLKTTNANPRFALETLFLNL